ncbi:hypothetical protein [Streptomyces sp. NPDC047042]|uniref:hypothetical protein n=1 Tax=Streptomyces sp. NPDC047042 TaxID=3154807 RepID=UPI0034100815
MSGPPCGNNPHFQMSPGDREAVDEFRAYLATRAQEKHMSMDDRPKALDALLAHVADNLPDEEASTAQARAALAPLEQKVRELEAQKRAKIRSDALLEGADAALTLDFTQLRRGETDFVSFEHAWDLGTIDASNVLRRLARPNDFDERLTKPEAPADSIDRVPISRSIRYIVRGTPEVPDEYNETRTIAPTEITLTYQSTAESQLGRIHAYVKGWWMHEGARVHAEAVGRHFTGDPAGWPEWLAAEARQHDPGTPS